MEQLEMTEQQTKFTAAKPEVPQMNLSTALQEDACDVLERKTWKFLNGICYMY